jgi:hypothetical protein
VQTGPQLKPPRWCNRGSIEEEKLQETAVPLIPNTHLQSDFRCGVPASLFKQQHHNGLHDATQYSRHRFLNGCATPVVISWLCSVKLPVELFEAEWQRAEQSCFDYSFCFVDSPRKNSGVCPQPGEPPLRTGERNPRIRVAWFKFRSASSPPRARSGRRRCPERGCRGGCTCGLASTSDGGSVP